jgi:acyl-CoA synthetase (AMP-forming)/AMP-acid ligase II
MINIVIDHFRRHILPYINPPFLETEENELMLLPFFHCYGFGMLCTALLTGTSGIVMAGFDPDLFCKTVQDFKVNIVKIIMGLDAQIFNLGKINPLIFYNSLYK